MLNQTAREKKFVNYSKWGYLFLTPFFVIYIIFALVPLCSTFYNSFFENYRVGLTQVGPTFVGFANFKEVMTNAGVPRYAMNTLIMWLLGFVPQIIVSLLLAVWFTNSSLKIKGKVFFKTVIYLPNLIMAAAFSMLFFTLFSPAGPINNILEGAGLIPEPIRFLSITSYSRGLIAFMNFLMWYGNTTILLMAGIMGIDESLFEAARIDGASSRQIFSKIILPLLVPILVFVMITSLIGGIQMFDVPQILTKGDGLPNRTTMTLIMYLNKHLFSRNFGLAGAVSVLIFLITAILSFIVYNFSMRDSSEKKRRS
ncbi:MAG: ABC transporter permease [Spirochaetaceae bacterium 4572_7]|nr:MAG: ABC transporter permease [Spirochaetaceae bacterium 4572_7]